MAGFALNIVLLRLWGKDKIPYSAIICHNCINFLSHFLTHFTQIMKVKIKLVLRKDRQDKDGQHHIRIRVISGNKVSYFPTGEYVRQDEWDGGEVVGKPNKTILNQALRKKLVDFEKRYLEAAITETPFVQAGSRKVDVHAFWESKVNSKSKKSYLGKLKSFRPVLYFSDLTPELLEEYEAYCYGLGNESNTVYNALKFVKSTINLALEKKIIKVNPSIGYKWPKYNNPKIDFLVEEEINKIEEFSMDETNPQTLRNVATWFLFGCYSFLRYSDCVQFSSDHIKENRLILRTEKTGTDVSIKIHTKLKGIISRLPEHIYTNQRMNVYLKTIGKQMGRDLNFHLSRHSAAVLFLTKGGSMETLSKLLGHSDLRTTQLYGKVINRKVDEEVDRVYG